MATLTAIASGYTGSSNFTISSSYPISRAYNNTSNTTYGRLTLSSRNGYSGIYFTGFDFSSIPSDATITGITAKVKVRVSSTSYVTSMTAQLYNGTTAKGSSTSCRSTTASTYTIASPGTWTRPELDNLRIYFYGKRSNGSTSPTFDIYGMEVTVTYTASEAMMYYKDNGTWKAASKVYQKVNGVWQEVTDLSTIDRTKNWVRGS